MRFVLLLLVMLNFLATASAQTLVRSYGSGCCNFGWAVADTPDLDGDGRRDFLVGAINTGQVIAHSSARAQPLATVQAPGTDLGYSLSTVPDLNGDGIADVIGGAPNANSVAGGGPGQVRIHSGRDGSAVRTIVAPAGSSLFGTAVAGIQDLDNDGAGDLLIGAPGSGGGAGRLYVMSGASGSTLFTIEAPAGGIFGAGVSSVADADNDGVRDILVAAPRANGGRAYVFSSATRMRLREFTPATPGQTFGFYFVADAGDVDADGRSDIYIGDYAEGNGNGAAYVFSTVTGNRLHHFVGSGGEGVGPGRGAGDVDGDGHADLIVGSYSYSGAGVNNGGRVRIFSGSDGHVLEEVVGDTAGAQLGFDAVGLGDVTGDGRLDFIASAASGGRVLLYAGAVDPRQRFAISEDLSGTWNDPDSSGQGFLFEVIESQRLIAGAWFTHATLPPGSGPAQRWFTFAGTYADDRATLPVFLSRGGRFGAGGGVQSTEVGSLILKFSDCTHGTATYSVRANAVTGDGEPAAGAMLEGSFALRRLTPTDRCGAATDDAAAFAAFKQGLDRILADSVGANGIIGTQAAVRIPGREPWIGVSGLNGSLDPMRPDLLIGTGSISKMLTVVAALRLVDRGKIRLEDPLGRWFDGVPNVDPSITVKQAMQQVSGIADYSANPSLIQAMLADRQRVWTGDELSTYIGPPLFAAGNGWNASNSNRLLLGIIVERESGMSLGDFMQQELFAGLSSSWVVGVGVPPSPLAIQWNVSASGVRTNVNDLRFGPSLFTYTREVHASASDLAAITERLFRGELLAPATRAAMLEIVPDDGAIPGQTGGGLGIRRYNLLGRTLFGHSGGTSNSSAFVLFDPATGIVVALSINQDGPSHGQSHFRTTPALLQAALDFVGG
jgi:CubicO group peptidase (beta-lactamase class C family)